MRSILDQAISLLNRLTDQPEFAVLEVTDSTVRHVRRSGRRPRTKISAFDQQDVHTIGSQVAKHANTVDAASNDKDGRGFVLEGSEDIFSIHSILFHPIKGSCDRFFPACIERS